MSNVCLTLEEVALHVQGRLQGEKSRKISGVASLEDAKVEDATFLANLHYAHLLKTTKAGVILVGPTQELFPGMNFIVVEDPSKAFQKLIEFFKQNSAPLSGFKGFHPTSVIHPQASVDPSCTICPHAVIDQEVVVGANSFIGSGVYIGPKTTIGKDCIIHPGVVIREGCSIGDRVIIQPNAVLGSCGYGYTQDKQGRHQKLDQLGNVVCEDDVEIGASTTIDRARFASTKIGQGTKVDNLVQIAHNVKIGKHCLIISQTGIAGSATLGNYVVLAGKVAINGHITLSDQVVVAACSGVSKSLESGRYAGVPVMKLSDYNKNSVLLRNIDKYIDEIEQLKSQVKALQEKLAE